MKVDSIIYLLIFIGVLFSCSKEKEEMDSWEAGMALELAADNIQLSHRRISSPTKNESYLELKIVNSQHLKKIAHNKRLMAEKCEVIKDATLNLPEIALFPEFTELRLTIIETHGALIFKSTKTNTINYKVYWKSNRKQY